LQNAIKNIVGASSIDIDAKASESYVSTPEMLQCNDVLPNNRQACDRTFATCQSWDHLINAVALHIRQSLNLSEILQSTVDNVHRLLKCDRVLIYQFAPDWSGQVVSESVSAPEWSVLDQLIHDSCFASNWLAPYHDQRYFAIEDIASANLTPCHAEFLSSFHVRANLVIPILEENTLWGLLIAHHCQSPRRWQTVEIEGLQMLATHVGIAVHQASLMAELQAAKAKLETMVAERTRELAEANAQLLEEVRHSQQLATIVKSSNDAIISKDLEGIITSWNPGAEAIFGYSATEMIGQPITTLIPPEYQEESAQILQRIYRGETVGTYETQRQCKDGRLVDLAITMSPLRDSNGTLVGVAKIARDISVRKQAETLMRAQAETLRIFYDTSPLLMGVVETTDDDILHVFHNPTTLAFLEMTPDMLDGQWASAVGLSPEQIQLWLEHYRRSHDSQEPVHFSYEHVISGDRKWLSATVAFVGIAESGRPQFSYIVQDVTEQHQLEQERKRANVLQHQAEQASNELALLENILDVVLAGYWDWRITTDEEYYSPGYKRMLGYADDELPNITQTWKDLVLPEDRQRISEQLNHHIQHRGRDPYYVEARFRHKDGSIVWVISSGKVIEWDADGKPSRMVGCHIDITERKKAEAALQESEATNRALIQAIPDFLVRMRQDGVQLEVINPDAVHCLQVELLPTESDNSVLSFMPNEIAQERIQLAQRAIATGMVQQHEYTLPYHGKLYHEEARIVPLSHDEVLVMVRDITKRVKTEQALRDSEATKQALIDSIPDLLVRIRHDGVYMDVLNRDSTTINIFAYDKNHAGAHITDALPPALAQQRLEYVQQVLATKMPITYEYQIEIQGTLYDEEARLIPLDETSVLVVIRDISDRKRAEAELRSTKEQLELVLQASSEGFWDWNLITHEIYFSPRWKEMLGYDDHELANTFEMWESVIVEDDRIATLQRVDDYNSGHVDTFEMIQRFHHKDGSTVFILSRAIHLKDDDGRVIRMVGSHLDMTDNKRQEIALQESEARYRNIIETTLEGVWMLDTDGKTTFVNQRMADMLGYAPEEMQHKSFLDFVASDEQAQAIAYFTRRQEGLQEQHSFKFYRQDGAELWTLISATPLLDKEGTYQGVIGLLTDITPLITAQSALEESKLQLGSILNISLDGIMAFRSVRDKYGQIIDFEWLLSNSRACQIVNQPVERLIGHRMLDVLPGNRADGLFDLYVQVVETGEPIQRQFHYAHDGIDTWFENAAVKLGDGFTVTFRDISSLKASEQALQQANQTLESHLHNLRQHNQEMLLLSETSDFLQACRTLDEACSVITTLVEPLFPGFSGSFHITCASRNRIESMAQWGNPSASKSEFQPQECWGLRRGKLHQTTPESPGLRCQHMRTHSPNLATLCIPMIAQGETLGMFHLNTDDPALLTDAKQQLARTVAEQVGLAIANLHLRETLQNQSIRDSLTGLFNRRYLEEALQKEIARAHRNQSSVVIVMVDVDHFKQVNDTYGHDAGDAALQAIAQILKTNIRESDTACRYGGEEMTLVFPDTSLEEAIAMAEKLRQQIQHLVVKFGSQQLRDLSASFGVAIFPAHGMVVPELIRTADTALYRAKATGRNKVVVADLRNEGR
jgi:diguanylate cyclase (GGDEF)-like protein/PAS domain S-box-containing protein